MHYVTLHTSPLAVSFFTFEARFMLERDVCDTERRDTEHVTAFVFVL